MLASNIETADATVSIPAEYQVANVKFAFRYRTTNKNTGGCTVFVDNVKLTASGRPQHPCGTHQLHHHRFRWSGRQLTPSGAVSVAKGGSQTFTIKPSDNYEIEDVKVDNQSVGKKTEYTFENVTKRTPSQRPLRRRL